jgi:ABC-2 type transport system permease protein
MSAVLREWRLLLHDRAALAVLALAFAASTLAVASGLSEVRAQRASLAALAEADARERASVAQRQADWGGAAYYSFHLTWEPPSTLAFAALGLREHGPWQHRIRMLALEGQVHEPDAGHPELALLGRFDFAFVVALLAPLFAILLLHGIAAGERSAGRHDLLLATARDGRGPWLARGAIRALLLGVALLLPFAVGAAIEGTPASLLAAGCGVVSVHLAFWWALCALFDRGKAAAPTQLMLLVGAWIALAGVAPAALAAYADRRHPLPEGGAILLAQREAVNDAWDLPKETTLRAFLERHPEWAPSAAVTRPFEWKWYFAFQQVGDQVAEPLSRAHREGRAARERLVDALAWLAPPAWVERRLEALAGTDGAAALAYEQRVRDFHARLRAWYYPRLFNDTAYAPQDAATRPDFAPHEH